MFNPTGTIDCYVGAVYTYSPHRLVRWLCPNISIASFVRLNAILSGCFIFAVMGTAMYFDISSDYQTHCWLWHHDQVYINKFTFHFIFIINTKIYISDDPIGLESSLPKSFYCFTRLDVMSPIKSATRFDCWFLCTYLQAASGYHLSDYSTICCLLSSK